MIGSALLVLLSAASIDAAAIAEINPSAESTAALGALDPDATVREGSPRVRLWQLSSPRAVAVLAALDAKLPGRFAAVFRDGPKLRVPAGGVMVWLAPGVNADAWARTRGLIIERDFGAQTLLLTSAPGAATLALAETLRADKRVNRVMPNWWLRAVRK